MTLPGHEACVRALAYDPVTGLLASGSYDGTIRIWEFREGVVSVARQPCPEDIADVVCSGTGSLCASLGICTIATFLMSSLTELGSLGMS